MKTSKWLWVVGVLWFGLSCYGLFFRSSGGELPAITYFDKVAHFGMFFGQFYVLAKIYPPKSVHRTLGLIVVALLWAVASELIQGYFTTRMMDVWDGVADMMGAILAVMMVRLCHRHI